MARVSMRCFRSLGPMLRGFTVSAEELVYLCKLHAAKCALRRERDIQLSASRPKRETKMGMRLSVGEYPSYEIIQDIANIKPLRPASPAED